MFSSIPTKALVFGLLLSVSSAARADDVTSPSPVTFGGYAEGYYQWNFNNPSNGITNFRGFDNQHNSFTLSNVALDALWDAKDIVGRLTLQIGHTPSTYYLAEPSKAGASGANATGIELWKYLQQAYAGYHFDVGGGLTVAAGLFLSPIGPEGMVVHDNWNWSRSNLFFGLPFYHTGAKATYSLTNTWSITVAAYNGWNSVVDNNAEKSVSTQFLYSRPDITWSILYFGGVERPTDAPEGRAWRHLFDTHATFQLSPRVSLLAHANAGFERNRFGTSGWAAGALYGKVQVLPKLFVAGRGDLFYEHIAQNAVGAASAIFWPVPWVAEGTATVDYRPHERVSFRFEYRYDRAAGDMFFGGNVENDATTTAFVPNRDAQHTLTLGATSWF